MRTRTLILIAAVTAGFVVAASSAGAQSGASEERSVAAPTADVVADLSGSRLEEFRELARDVEATAARAHATAKRSVKEYPDRGDQFVGELNYLVARSRDLQILAAGKVNREHFAPIVDRLMMDARQVDRGMRDAGVFASVWDDSGWTITKLKLMASLVGS